VAIIRVDGLAGQDLIAGAQYFNLHIAPLGRVHGDVDQAAAKLRTARTYARPLRRAATLATA
jgi:hypothetical protein